MTGVPIPIAVPVAAAVAAVSMAAVRATSPADTGGLR